MKTTYYAMIYFGFFIIALRAPLIFAPYRVRRAYVIMLGNTGSMRLIGLLVAAIAGLVAWETRSEYGTNAEIVYVVSCIIGALALILYVLLAGPVCRMAVNVWRSFNVVVLRLIGLLSTAVGAWLVWYGWRF